MIDPQNIETLTANAELAKVVLADHVALAILCEHTTLESNSKSSISSRTSEEHEAIGGRARDDLRDLTLAELLHKLHAQSQLVATSREARDGPLAAESRRIARVRDLTHGRQSDQLCMASPETTRTQLTVVVLTARVDAAIVCAHTPQKRQA